jgi:recombination protein RecT
VALHAVNGNRDILQCTPASIVEAIREAAALRLEPTGLLGDAYLVRYGDQARLMPGYRGLMKLARRSGEVEKIDAQVVYDGDAFAIHLGTDPEILHDPVIDGDRGNFTGAYAYARMTTGEVIVEWMSVADIEVVRRSSKASTKGPWVTFWGEMARKTVLRRLMKRLPLSTDAEQGLRLEAEAEVEATLDAKLPARRTPAAERVRAQLGIATGSQGDITPSPPSSAGASGGPAPVGGAPVDAQPDDHSGDPTAAWSRAEQRAMQSGDPVEADDDLPPMP